MTRKEAIVQAARLTHSWGVPHVAATRDGERWVAVDYREVSRVPGADGWFNWQVPAGVKLPACLIEHEDDRCYVTTAASGDRLTWFHSSEGARRFIADHCRPAAAGPQP